MKPGREWAKQKMDGKIRVLVTWFEFLGPAGPKAIFISRLFHLLEPNFTFPRMLSKVNPIDLDCFICRFLAS